MPNEARCWLPRPTRSPCTAWRPPTGIDNPQHGRASISNRAVEVNYLPGRSILVVAGQDEVGGSDVRAGCPVRAVRR
jgi:hypothetical protein